MYLKKVSFEKNFHFYYIDCTYELDNLVKNSNLSPESAIVLGRFMSFILIANYVLKPFLPAKEVIYEMQGSRCGIYQIKVDENLNLSIYVQNPQLSYEKNFKNEDLDVSNFVLNKNDKKFNFHIYDNLNKETIVINNVSNFESNVGNITEDLLLYLNKIGMKRAALSLGVQTLFNPNVEVSCCGGYLCHVQNNFQNKDLISNLKLNLDNSFLIKDLQKKFNHNDEVIIENVLQIKDLKIATKNAYYVNNSKQIQESNFNFEMLNTKLNESDFLVCGINEELKKAQCFWVNLKNGELKNFDLKSINKISEKSVKYHVSNLYQDIEFSGNSHQLSYFIYKKYKNFDFVASGCVDDFGNIHYINNAWMKILCFEHFGLKRVYLPLENKSELLNKIRNTNLEIEIKFVDNIKYI